MILVRVYVSVKKSVVYMKKQLCELEVGEAGIVTDNSSRSDIRRRFLDIGLINGAYVECVGKSPLGDPLAYLIKGTVIAIRKNDCNKITVVTKTP